jgi:hypothetical protein
MNHTLNDLRGALREEADHATYPDIDALVTGAQRRVGAARRRRLAALSAATATVLVVGGLIAATGSVHKAVPLPANPGLGQFSVNTGGAGFPEHSEGMERIMVLDAPMLGRLNGLIEVPTTAGRQLAVRMTCTQNESTGYFNDNTNEWNDRMIAKFSAPGGSGRAGCGGTEFGSDLIGVATGARTTVLADVTINTQTDPGSSLFKDAKIHVAIYGSVPWKGYTLPTRPAGLSASSWPSDPAARDGIPQGPTTAATANEALTIGFDYDPKREVRLEVRGPGRLRVIIDGNIVSDKLAPRASRDGYLTHWDYDEMSFTFPLDASIGLSTAPSAKPGTQVSLVIIPQDFAGPDWRVSYQPIAP